MSDQPYRVPVDPTAGSMPTSLWPGLENPSHSAWYVQRFRTMAAAGDDVLGESRLMDD